MKWNYHSPGDGSSVLVWGGPALGAGAAGPDSLQLLTQSSPLGGGLTTEGGTCFEYCLCPRAFKRRIYPRDFLIQRRGFGSSEESHKNNQDAEISVGSWDSWT